MRYFWFGTQKTQQAIFVDTQWDCSAAWRIQGDRIVSYQFFKSQLNFDRNGWI